MGQCLQRSAFTLTLKPDEMKLCLDGERVMADHEKDVVVQIISEQVYIPHTVQKPPRRCSLERIAQ